MEVMNSLPQQELGAFLDAIQGQPDDDTPRLVLADWIEEHGSQKHAEFAEFIRVQCLHAQYQRQKKRKKPLEGLNISYLRTRNKELCKKMYPRGILGDKVNPREYLYRGFLNFPVQLWSGAIPPVLENASYWYTNAILQLTNHQLDGKQAAKWLQEPCFRRLQELNITACWGPVRHLFQCFETSPILPRLRSFYASRYIGVYERRVQNAVYYRELLHILALRCTQLRFLRLWGQGLQPQDLTLFLKPCWATLEWLDLSGLVWTGNQQQMVQTIMDSPMKESAKQSVLEPVGLWPDAP